MTHKQIYLKELKRIRKSCKIVLHNVKLISVFGHDSSAYFMAYYDSLTNEIHIASKQLYKNKIQFLLHEEGHFLCNKSKCKCFKIKNQAKCEFHAEKHCLENLLRINNPLLFKAAIETRALWHSWFKKDPKYYLKYFPGHIMCQRKLKQSPLWRKVLRKVKK